MAAPELPESLEDFLDEHAPGAGAIVSVSDMKRELRIDAGLTDHDDMLAEQIASAVAYVESQTGRTLDADAPKALRQAVILLTRELYDGYRELRPPFALLAPYRRLVREESG